MTLLNHYNKLLTINKQKLQALKKHPIRNYFKIRKVKAKIQATEEGQRDILNTTITDAQATTGVVDKNNYKTYAKQVDACYDMYDSRVDYGSEFFRGIVDTRVSFIGGEGLSVVSKNKTTNAYCEKFLKSNKLHGSNLMKQIQRGELEGRNLLLLKKNNNKRIIEVHQFSWWTNKYSVQYNGDTPVKIIYRDKETQKEKMISIDKSVVVILGGSGYRKDRTPGRIHCVLTEIENASRAKFDLRKNAHIFGKLMPYWNTSKSSNPRQAALSINNDVSSGDWTVGQGYAGDAEFSFVEPAGGAAEMLKTDILLNLKNISATTGIPIHWLAYPELMSNRATAENLMEVVAAATRKERLIWQEAYKELIEKSMQMAIEAGFEKNNIRGDFEVYLPMISTSLIKQLSETWLPLQQMDVISMGSLRNRIPGINPLAEEKMVKDEKEQTDNRTIDDRLKQLQEEQNLDKSNTDSDNR